MKYLVTFILAENVRKFLPRIADKPHKWLYLGKDIRQREHISQLMGERNRYIIGNLLQETALEEKESFINFIAGLGSVQKNKHHWWASTISYKSPLASDFFLLWCYASVVKKVCLEENIEKEQLLIILIQDRWLYKYLQKNYQKSHPNLNFSSHFYLPVEIAKQVVKNMARRGYSSFKTASRVFCIRRLVCRNPAVYSDCFEKQVYIYSWINNRSFTADGRFKDSYFGPLYDILKEADLNVGYVTQIFLDSKLIKRCLNSINPPFILLDRYIRLRDVIKRLLSFNKISLPKDMDNQFPSIRLLLQRETLLNFLSSDHEMLSYVAFKNWLKKVKQKEVTVIYPFENQPWEKLLCMGARECGKNIKLIGYQHSGISSLLLNYFPGHGGADNMPIPDYIVANGAHSVNLLKEAGFSRVKLINGGAFKFEHLHKSANMPVKKDRFTRTVLVAFSYSPTLTAELLISLSRGLADLAEQQITIFLKPHPDTPLSKLGIQLPELPSYFKYTDKSISEILKEADLVLYSSSTTGLESLLAGVPIIKYSSELEIELDPIDMLAGERVISCSEKDIKQVVLESLNNLNGAQFQKTSVTAKKLNYIFSPVDRDLWQQVVSSSR